MKHGEQQAGYSQIGCKAMRLVQLLRSQKELDRAAELARETWAEKRRVLGDEHKSTLVTYVTLVRIRRDQGAYEEAAVLAEDCFERTMTVYGEDHKNTKTMIRILAGIYRRWGKPDEEAKWKAMLE